MRAYVEWVNGLHDHDAMARNRFVEIGRDLRGAPVVAVGAARRIRGALHLGAVGQPGAREAARLGLVDGQDFLAVA
jgi:hypothetical protein